MSCSTPPHHHQRLQAPEAPLMHFLDYLRRLRRSVVLALVRVQAVAEAPGSSWVSRRTWRGDGVGGPFLWGGGGGGGWKEGWSAMVSVVAVEMLTAQWKSAGICGNAEALRSQEPTFFPPRRERGEA